MKQKLLLSVLAVGLFGCDNQVENKPFVEPKIPSVLLKETGDSKSVPQPTDRQAKKALDQKGVSPIVQKSSESKDSTLAPNTATPQGEIVIPEVVEILLKSHDDGVYDIIVSTDGLGFDVQLDDKPVLSSYPISAIKQQKIAPLMADVATEICLIKETEKTLFDLSPKKLLSYVTQSDDGKHVIKKSRLKTRIILAEKKISSLLDRAIKISQTPDELLNKRLETFLVASNDDVYEVAISAEGFAFDVKKNGTLILSSDEISPIQFESVQPMMADVFKKMEQLEEDEDRLDDITPKTLLGELPSMQSNQHVITRSRLEVRTQVLQHEIIDTLMQVLDKLDIENEPSSDNKMEDLPKKQPVQQTPMQMKKLLSFYPNHLKMQNQRA